MPRPIPRLPPVTTTTFPENSCAIATSDPHSFDPPSISMMRNSGNKTAQVNPADTFTGGGLLDGRMDCIAPVSQLQLGRAELRRMDIKVSRQAIAEATEKLKNWGRWGKDDQVGTLNHVQPE